MNFICFQGLVCMEPWKEAQLSFSEAVLLGKSLGVDKIQTTINHSTPGDGRVWGGDQKTNWAISNFYCTWIPEQWKSFPVFKMYQTWPKQLPCIQNLFNNSGPIHQLRIENWKWFEFDQWLLGSTIENVFVLSKCFCPNFDMYLMRIENWNGVWPAAAPLVLALTLQLKGGACRAGWALGEPSVKLNFIYWEFNIQALRFCQNL